MSQAEEFEKSVENLVDYFREEFNLTLGEIVGTLEVIKFKIMRESEEHAVER
jgi:hypothetical protein